MGFLTSLLSFIVAIGVLVFVHEFGHFWVARKCGVKIERFSIGFGKVIFKRKDKLGTEFAISAIPLGGYVKMLDERNEPVPDEFKPQAFNNKKLWQRFAIVAAGPIANFIFAIFAYWVVFVVGVPSVKPVIENVQAHSIAAQAGIESNYQIIAVNGKKTPDWESINLQLSAKIGEQQAVLTLVPFGYGEESAVSKTLDLRSWQYDPEKQSSYRSLGIEPYAGKAEMRISRILENSPAQLAGLQEGDHLLAEDGSEIHWTEFVQAIQAGKDIRLLVDREGQRFYTQLFPKQNEQGRWVVGISPTALPLAEQYRTELKYDILEAFQKGVEKTADLTAITFKILGKLFTGDVSPKSLSGPISIAKGAGATASYGWIYYVMFMALISVNLGIMNLLPLPVLDGGHLLFFVCEGILGKPVPQKIQTLMYYIGASLLLLLTVFALFNDFLRL